MPTDPTRTTTVRSNWASDYSGRWRAIRGEVREELRAGSDTRYTRDAPVEAEFRPWLSRRLDNVVLEPARPSEYRAGYHWTGGRVRDAYDRGLSTAATALRKTGVDDRVVDRATAARSRTHRERREREFARAYIDTEDIVNAALSDAVSSLSGAIDDGATTSETISLVNDRIDVVGGTRSEVAAATIPVRVANRAALAAYAAADVDGVGIRAESQPAGVVRVNAEPDSAEEVRGIAYDVEERESQFTTAGDEDVCEECEGYADRVWSTIDVLEGHTPFPPLHPRCRCMFLPV